MPFCYAFAVTGVNAEHTGLQMRSIFRRRAKYALGHDKKIRLLVSADKIGVARPFRELAQGLTKFKTRPLSGKSRRQFLILVDLPHLATCYGVTVFATSELAHFIRQVIKDSGWSIQGESPTSSIY